jgi:hypothetical protein
MSLAKRGYVDHARLYLPHHGFAALAKSKNKYLHVYITLTFTGSTKFSISLE